MITRRLYLLFFSTLMALTQFGDLAQAQIASGGQFSLSQSVIASGGSSIQAGQFKLDGTSGQAIAGQKAAGQSFADRAGFWTPTDLLPTAAQVSVSGLVTTASGSGIQNVIVVMMDPTGQSRSVKTGTFGFFQFEDVEVGRTYIFSVTSRRFQFPQSTLIRAIMDASDDLHFVALSN